MNQAKWLSDFRYDIESTPLLWSFDDPEQDTEPSRNEMRSKSFLRVSLRSVKRQEINENEIPVYEAVKTMTDLELKSASTYNEVAKETSLERDNVSHGKALRSTYLDLTNGDATELYCNKYEDRNIAESTDLAENEINTRVVSRECSNERAEPNPSDMIYIDSTEAPTYLEILSKDCENRRLISKVKRFPSYLAIRSPDEENQNDVNVSNAEESVCNSLEVRTNPVALNYIRCHDRLKEDVRKDVFRRRLSSTSLSDTEIVDDVEYLSGGIWYSDEEEERAIERLCAYENPAFEPDVTSSDSEDDSNTTTERSISTHRKKLRKTGKCDIGRNFGRQTTSSDPYRDCSKSESIKGKSRLSSIRTIELSDDFDESDDDTVFSLNTGHLADIVPFDEVASLIENCVSESEHEDTNWKNGSKALITSRPSPAGKVAPPSSSPHKVNESPTTETGCDLEWDTYMPPLTIQWSDVMVQQIFDTVEKDNERYVTQLRKLVQRSDMRPLNILQRLYWYDESSGSLQSLVGVFEYDL